MNRDSLSKIFCNADLIYPGEFGQNAYEDARNLIIETYHDVSGLVAIYEFGKINNPGISDLDLIFVFADGLNDADVGSIFLERELSVFVQNILCGSTLMVISENDFKNILIWDDLVLSRLYGKDIPINNMDKDRDLREIVQIMDWLPERILSIKKQLNVNSIPLIRFLGLLHSLNYTFDKIIRRGYIPYERVKEYREHLESTANARRSFLSYSDAQARDILVSLTENAFMLGYFAMERVVNCVSKYKCKNVSNNLSLGNFLLTIDSGYEFYVAGENYIDLVFRQKIENKIIPVPMEWALHWKVYGEIDGMISKKIRNAFTNEENIKGDVETKIRSLMHRRIVHCNSMADFLLCNGFAKGLYKFGWFFNR